MAESRGPEFQGGASEAELCLSQAPPTEPGPAYEGLDQNCCKTKKKQSETVSRENEAALEAPGPGCDGPGCTTVQCLRTSTLPVIESHSLSVIKQDPAGELSCAMSPDTCTLAQDACTMAQDLCTFVQNPCTLVDSSAGGPVLVCKRPMQLQQCNMVTTVCRGALGSDGTVPQQFQGPLGPQGPQMAAAEEPPCDGAPCYGSHFHHTNLEDTFAAYCHPQPIPATSQLLPPLTGPEGATHLSLPRLMSSLSETGLDAKHVSCCCQLGCSWVSMLPPPQRTCTMRVLTRDVGTLTASRGLRDVGVQTEDSSSHVFPQVCLNEELHRESKKTSQDITQKAGSKSPVKEVKWDAEGMTWEVYGASVDPEELGLAIQKHLELQIKETASRAAKLSRQNTNTSRHSGSVSCQRKRRVLGSLRPPACCARTTTAVD